MQDMVTAKRRELIGWPRPSHCHTPFYSPIAERVADVDETLGEQFLTDVDPTNEELKVLGVCFFS